MNKSKTHTNSKKEADKPEKKEAESNPKSEPKPQSEMPKPMNKMMHNYMVTKKAKYDVHINGVTYRKGDTVTLNKEVADDHAVHLEEDSDTK